MRKSAAYLLPLFLLIIIAGIVFFQLRKAPEAPAVGNPASENGAVAALGSPSFQWTYESFTEEEIPYTSIGLVARYDDGSLLEKDIDTVAGDCNDYGDPDPDLYPQSGMIICYYAGLGHYYKVVESENAYLVQRKIFEEASLEYSPEPQPFETVAKFDK